jgi:acetylornithine deacetylase
MGEDPAVEGMEAPCDMYVFHRFGTPAILWGPRGANAHAPDEYVDIKSLVAATETLYAFVTRWCGVAEEAGASVQNRTSAAPNPAPPAS